MEKPKLFEEWKHFVLTIAALLFLLLLRLGFEYHAYQQFISLPFFFTDAKVLAAYDKQKENRRYQVLKLKSKEGYTFFTTTHQKGNLADKRLRLQLFPDEHISFWDYLGTFYVKSRIRQTEQKSLTFKERLYEKVVQQHLDPSLQSFYNAIFFATPLPKEMRQKISLLGISHLVALSGFHLGILWGLVYGMLLLLYRPLQQRYFPYRFALLDVGGVSILILGFYVWFVGTPPSLLRAYAMVLIGWSILLMGIELLSFTFLATVIFLLAVIFPSLLVSLGFWFSVAGVLYIYLLLHYTKSLPKWQINLAIIPLGIFLLMLPVVHTVFPATSPYQLLSPLLSLLFIPFYPVSILLHAVGMGDLSDSLLLWLFTLPSEGGESIFPLWMFGVYLTLSLFAIRSRKAFYGTLGVSTFYAGILFAGAVF